MNTLSSKIIRPLVMGACVLSLAACSGMSDTQQRTVTGAGIGAGVGAVGAAATGHSAIGGAAIGAGVGAAGGYLYDKSKEDE